jgi:hypothetical protein
MNINELNTSAIICGMPKATHHNSNQMVDKMYVRIDDATFEILAMSGVSAARIAEMKATRAAMDAKSVTA